MPCVVFSHRLTYDMDMAPIIWSQDFVEMTVWLSGESMKSGFISALLSWVSHSGSRWSNPVGLHMVKSWSLLPTAILEANLPSPVKLSSGQQLDSLETWARTTERNHFWLSWLTEIVWGEVAIDNKYHVHLFPNGKQKSVLLSIACPVPSI